MSFAFLDLTTDRLKAWQRGPSALPRSVPLDHDREALPLAVRGDQRKLQVGHAALQHCREMPHDVWTGFLPQLGETRPVPLGRHRLTPEDVLRTLLQLAKERLGSCRRWLIAIPAYLKDDQIDCLQGMMRDLGVDLLGMVPRGLLLAQSIHEEEQPWKSLGVLADVDSAGFTLHVIRPTKNDLHLVQERHLPLLGRQRWLDRLIEAVATASIHLHRRDPRSSAHSDQELFNQSRDWLRLLRQGSDLTARFTPTHRTLPYELQLRRASAEQACKNLNRAAAEEWLLLLRQVDPTLQASTLFCSAAAGELPGLLDIMQSLVKTKLPVCVVDEAYPAAALRLAGSIEEKERQRISFASKCIRLGDAEFTFDASRRSTGTSEAEFVFDAPSTLPFPEEPWLIKKPMAEPIPEEDRVRPALKRHRPARED